MGCRKVFPGTALIFLAYITGCDLLTGPEKPDCAEPITGSYDLVSYDGQSLPSRVSRTLAGIGLGGGTDTVELLIVGGQLTLSEDGTFEETGVYRLPPEGDSYTVVSPGSYTAREHTVEFLFHVENGWFGSSSEGPWVGRRTKGGVTLKSEPYSFLHSYF